MFLGHHLLYIIFVVTLHKAWGRNTAVSVLKTNCSDNKKCTCQLLEDGTIKVNCSGLKLESIPNIYGDVSAVDFSFNCLTDITSNGRIPPSVRNLDFSHNLIRKIINSTFVNIPNLRMLVLNNNDIRHLDENVFSNVPRISHLDVSSCKLRHIMNGSLSVLRQLKYLNVSHNRYLTFRVLKNISYDLKYSDVEVIDISKLHCTFGPGIFVYRDDIAYIKTTKLKALYMSSNRISQFESGTPNLMPETLEAIDVRDNILNFGKYLIDSSSMINLRTVDASYQYKTHFPSLDNNPLYSCYDWQWKPPSPVFLMDYDQSLHTIVQSDYNTGEVIIPPPKRLETINIAGSRFRLSIPSVTFSKNNSIKTIIVNRNNAYSWIGPVLNLHRLEYLDMSSNYCSNISSVFLSDVPELKTLDISYNLLGYVLDKVKPFDYLYKLETLNISNNKIANLDPKIFENNPRLTHLVLKSNSLKTWIFHIKTMPQLRYINLARNSIVTIPEHIMNEISFIAETRKGHFTINLQSNRFVCNCNKSMLRLVVWIQKMQSQHGLFEGYRKYTCFSSKGEIIFLSDDDKVNEIERNCTGYVELVSGVLAAIVFSMSTVICGLVYRYRWKLRYLIFIAKTKYLGQAETKRSQNDDLHFRFDAFVSYADEDGPFVTGMFPEELENKLGCRLCLHQRDFTPGKSVSGNITAAIHHSRKTVVILSPSYLKSYWCMYEFNMARMESIYAREEQNIIFIVLYKRIPVKSIPLEVLSLMEGRSYIEYPRNQDDECVVFWNRLGQTISS